MTNEEWLGTPKAADRLGVSQKTLYKMINQGDLPAYKLGRNIRVRSSDLESFLENRRVTPGDLDHLLPDVEEG